MANRKMVFIAGLLSQPRCIKRVKSFVDDGFDCDVYGYDRGKYDVNTYPEGVKLVKFGVLEDGGNYIKKAIKIYKDIKRCARKYKKENVVFYAFGFTQALVLRLLGKKYVYEISDILYAYPQFYRYLPFLKKIDKKLILKSVATTMTSGGFYCFYGLKNKQIFVVPNKVSPSLSRNNVTQLQKTEGSLSFGFVGAIRYETVFRFAEVIGKYFPQHSFHFYGGTLLKQDEERLTRLHSQYKNIYSHGTFKNPQDLPAIYNTLDIVVACYTVQSLNERLAEPNKLYEAIFYCKPIVVSTGIYLSDRVQELRCGYCINATTDKDIQEFISNLSLEEINSISMHEMSIQEKEFVSNQDELNSYLSKLFD